MDLNFREPAADLFEGEYRELLSKLWDNTWLGVVYVVASVSIIYSMSLLNKPFLMEYFAEIPLFVICYYILSPNKRLTQRLFWNWVLTTILAGLIYAYSNSLAEKIFLGNAIGIVIWCFILYWLLVAFTWSVRIRRENLDKSSRSYLIEFIAVILTTWGATLQIAFCLTLIVIPFFENMKINSSIFSSIDQTARAIRMFSIFKIFPISILLLGILIKVALRFKQDKYRTKSISDLFPEKGKGIIGVIINALQIPAWMVYLIGSFINHFSKLLVLETFDFLRFWVARMIYLILGVLLPPLLLYCGHNLLYHTFDLLSIYLMGKAGIVESIIMFFKINALVIIVLLIYYISIPLLSIKYRGVVISEIFDALHHEIFVIGKKAADAVGQTFSLVGVIVFAVPVAVLLPGGQKFGTFSVIYSIIILPFILYYIFLNKAKASSNSYD